ERHRDFNLVVVTETKQRAGASDVDKVAARARRCRIVESVGEDAIRTVSAAALDRGNVARGNVLRDPCRVVRVRRADGRDLVVLAARPRRNAYVVFAEQRTVDVVL